MFAAGGKSVITLLKNAGFECTYINRVLRKSNGIEAVRQMFPRCWFDKKNTARGIEALSQYRTKGDPNDEVNDSINAGEPLHNWCSHFADGFQTMALYEQWFDVEPVIKKDPIISGKDEDFKRSKYIPNYGPHQNAWMGN